MVWPGRVLAEYAPRKSPLELRARLVPIIFLWFLALQALANDVTQSNGLNSSLLFLRTASLDPNYRCDLIGQPLPFL